MIFSCLINIKPFILLQGPLRDRSKHLLILPPFLRCIYLLCLTVKLLGALNCYVSLNVFLFLIHEENKAFAEVFERGPAIGKHLAQHVQKLAALPI